MAGAGYKLFNTGDVLTAAQVNTYLQEQAVMRFANSTARTTALSGVLAEGMMSYLDDTNSVEVYNGSSWVSVGSTGDITGVTAGTGISGGGASGDVTITNSMATAIDAKGDLIVGTGADTFSRLAVGTNGHTLVADSSETTGLKWQAASGGLKSYTLLNSGGTALTGAGTVTVSGISNQQALLILVSNASSASAGSQINVRINTDTGANYNVFGMEWQAAAIARDEGTGATQIPLGILANNAASQLSGFCHLFGTNSSSGAIGFIANGMANAGGGSGQKGYFYSGWYTASAAVTSISIVSGTGNLDNGTVYVYGMAA